MALLAPTYSFNRITARQLIDEAYLMCGVPPEQIDSKLVDTALFGINMVISKWINSGVLQFNEVQTLVKLQNYITRYTLPTQFYDVYDFNLATLGRRRAGISYSNGGGIAANAFDGDITTACTQTIQNGIIGINFAAAPLNDPIRVDFIGILSNIDTYYNLVLEGSMDGLSWTTLWSMKRPYFFNGFQSELSTLWFQVDQPQNVKFLQIREVGGNILNIRELYFEQYVNSIYRTGIGRSTFMQMANRDNPSSPTLFSLEKGATNITINTYQAPSNIPENQDYSPNASFQNFILMRAVEYPFDVNYLSDVININRLFIPALMYGLAAQLSLRVQQKDLFGMYESKANEELMLARQNNVDLGGVSVQKNSYSA
jgi:hypothetical protein